MRRIKLAALVVAAGVGLSGSLAEAAETLKLNVPPGSSWNFSESQDANFDMSVAAAGNQFAMQQKMALKMLGTVEVLESNAGRPSKMKVSFDPTCTMTMTATLMGQTQTQPTALPMAGKTYIATRTDTGITIEPAANDPAVQQTIEQMMKLDEEIYPNEPVDVGSKWETPEIASPDGSKRKMDFEVKGFDTVNGRKVVKLDVNATLSGQVNGANMTGTMKGPAVMDLATGLQNEVDMSGDVNINGQMTEQGMPMQVTGTGTLHAVNKTSNLKSANAAGPDIAAPRPAGDAVDAPANPAAPTTPVQPPAVANATGNYSGDGLKVALAGRAIKIEMNNLHLDGTVNKQDGNTLNGAFTHDGQSYDFTITLDGDKMQFNTGTKTYNLDRERGNNPLG